MKFNYTNLSSSGFFVYKNEKGILKQPVHYASITKEDPVVIIPPKYEIIPSALYIDEGNALTYTIYTPASDNNKTIFWRKVSGTATEADFGLLPDEYTTLLLRGDSLTDLSSYNHSITAVNGAFIGNDPITPTGKSLQIPNAASWFYATHSSALLFPYGTPYTIEFFCRPIALGGMFLWMQHPTLGNGYITNSNPATYVQNSSYQLGTNVLGGRRHLAISRDENNICRTFNNGVLIMTHHDTFSIRGGTQYFIGAWPEYNQGARCAIDNFRVSKGIARYTSNFTPYSTLTGSVIINSGTASFQLEALVDRLTEGNESLSIGISLIENGDILAATSEITISETSATYYAITPSVTSVDEGISVPYTVVANVVDGTILYYRKVSGTAIEADFTSPLSGSVTINSTAASFYLYTLADSLTEGPETIVMGISTSVDGPIVATAASVLINDTSQPTLSNLLLHGDGANGYTTFIDSSPSAHTIVPHGTAVISTAQSKFGGSSIYLDGSVGAYLAIADHSDFDLSLSSFTVECFVRLAALPTTNNTIHIFSKRLESRGYYFSINLTPTTFNTFWHSWDRFGNWNPIFGPSITPSLNWVHVAVCRYGNSTYRVFVNGIGGNVGTIADNPNISSPIFIGKDAGAVSGTFPVYFDELRLIKGTAMYTDNFTPPTAPF